MKSIILAALLSLAWTTAPLAQIDPAKGPAAKKAATTFLTISKDASKTGTPPREQDASIRELLDAVFDTGDIDAAKTISFQALTPLSERISIGMQVATVYMLAGTGVAELGQLGNVENGSEKVNINTVQFAPEMGRYLDFQVKIQTAITDAVLTRLATAKPDELSRPKFQSGIENIRGGSAGIVSGVIEVLALNGLTEEWRRARLPALMKAAPSLAKFLNATQKAELQQLAINCADVMDDASVKAALQEFSKIVLP